MDAPYIVVLAELLPHFFEILGVSYFVAAKAYLFSY